MITSLFTTRFDAFLAVSSFSYQRIRVEASISIRRFPPLMVSSLIFVIDYISAIIVVINASRVSGII